MDPSASSVFIPRKQHHKSRNGCLSCKSRKVKCDEKSPRCSRCEFRLEECIYPPRFQKMERRRRRRRSRSQTRSRSRTRKESQNSLDPFVDGEDTCNAISFSVSGSGSGSSPEETQTTTTTTTTTTNINTVNAYSSTISNSPRTSSYRSPYADSVSASTSPLPCESQTRSSYSVDSFYRFIDAQSASLNLSDLELMHHYLQHTGKTLAEQNKADRKAYAWLHGAPELALKHSCVAHSLLAFSALCICHDKLREAESEIRDSRDQDDGSCPGFFHEASTTIKRIDLSFCRQYLLLAETHHGQSLSALQNILSQTDNTNEHSPSLEASKDAAFVTSCLLAIYTPAVLSIRYLRERLLSKQVIFDDATLSRWKKGSAQSLADTYDASFSDEGPFITGPSGLMDWFTLLRGATLTSRHRTQNVHVQALRDPNNCITVSHLSLDPSSDEVIITSVGSSEDAGQTQTRFGVAGAYTHPLSTIVRTTGLAALKHLHNLLQAECDDDDDDAAEYTEMVQRCLDALRILDRAVDAFCASPVPLEPMSSHLPDTIISPPESYSPGMPAPLHDAIPSRSMMTWVTSAPAPFIELLKNGRCVMADAVLASWLVFMLLQENTWWYGDIGKVELRRIVEKWVVGSADVNCDGGDPEVKKWFEWPLMMLGIVQTDPCDW